MAAQGKKPGPPPPPGDGSTRQHRLARIQTKQVATSAAEALDKELRAQTHALDQLLHAADKIYPSASPPSLPLASISQAKPPQQPPLPPGQFSDGSFIYTNKDLEENHISESMELALRLDYDSSADLDADASSPLELTDLSADLSAPASRPDPPRNPVSPRSVTRSPSQRKAQPTQSSENILMPNPLTSGEQRFVWLGLLAFLALGTLYAYWQRPKNPDLAMREANYKLAAAGYASQRRWVEQGIALAKTGQHKAALDAFHRGRALFQIAQLHHRRRRYAKAAVFFAYTNHWERAAKSYEKAGQARKAADIYRMINAKGAALRTTKSTQQWDKMAQLMELQGEAGKAAKLYEKAKQWHKAGAIYLKRKQWQFAQEAFRKGKLHLHFAQTLLLQQQYKKAAAHFEEHGLLRCAAAAQLFNRQSRKAAKLYLQAAQEYKSFSLLQRASRAAERGRRYSQTRRILKQALALAEAHEQYKHVIDLYEQRGRLRSGLRALRYRGDRYLKEKEIFKARRLFLIGMNYPRLSFRDRQPFVRRLRRLKRPRKTLPKLVSVTHEYIREKGRLDGDASKGSGSVKAIRLKVEVDTPVKTKTTRIALHCRLFRKSLARFIRAKNEEVRDTEFCRDYRGNWRDIQAFEKAPTGLTFVHRLPELKPGSPKQFTIEHPLRIPYRDIKCVLQRKIPDPTSPAQDSPSPRKP